MSTTKFTTKVTDYPAKTDCPAFRSTTVQHERGSFTASAMEPADEGRKPHVAAYVHGTTAVEVAGHGFDDGDTAVVVRLVGEVSTSITIHGISLDDLLVAVQAARVSS